MPAGEDGALAESNQVFQLEPLPKEGLLHCRVHSVSRTPSRPKEKEETVVLESNLTMKKLANALDVNAREPVAKDDEI